MAEMIRTFIAIELSDDHRRVLSKVQMKLKEASAAKFVRWVAPETVHITLKFLGDVDAAQMPALQKSVADACVGIAPFTLKISGVGVFPNTRRPNVVWVGAHGDVESAVLLAKKLEDGCEMLGFPREGREFSPHLTLGRVKREAGPNDRRLVGEMIEKVNIGELGVIQVAHINVMKSELKPTGSVYTRLAMIQLDNG